MNRIAPYAKALTGAAVAGLGAARLALTDDVISRAEGIDISIATLTALALVWAIPNGNKPPVDDGQSYEEAGGNPYPSNEP